MPFGPLGPEMTLRRRLAGPFFARDARIVARALLGCTLVHASASEAGASPVPVRAARIVETEAYRGPDDLACHARAGLTKRTRALFGPEGHAYVFLVYGMHECFNVTCYGSGRGHAVLVRAGEPLAGLPPDARLDGPGRFARAMGLTRLVDGHPLTSDALFLLERPAGHQVRIRATPRVGVAYAGLWADKPWRFFDAASRCVSKPPARAIGRLGGAA